MKRKLLLWCLLFGLSSAQVVSAEPLTTGVNQVEAGKRNVSIQDIYLSESAPGLFKKDSVIYLRGEHLRFEDGITAKTVTGDLSIKKVETDGDLIKITIEKSSTELSRIYLENVSLYLDNNLPDGMYSLDLVTESGALYPNNLFGTLYDQNLSTTSSVPLLKNFVQIKTPTAQIPVTLTAQLDGTTTVSVSSNQPEESRSTVVKNTYLSHGRLMLPVRAVFSALGYEYQLQWDKNDLFRTENDGSAYQMRLGENKLNWNGNNLSWIGSGGSTYHIRLGENKLLHNGVEVKTDGALELKDGRAYLPLRTLALLLDAKVEWNAASRTATAFFSIQKQ